MGDSQHPLGPRLGGFLFTYAQGSEYANMVKNAISMGSLLTVAVKFLGFSNVTVGGVVALAALLYVGVALVAGRYHVKWGGAREQAYRANQQNPWTVRTLEILERIDRYLDVIERSGNGNRTAGDFETAGFAGAVGRPQAPAGESG